MWFCFGCWASNTATQLIFFCPQRHSTICHHLPAWNLRRRCRWRSTYRWWWTWSCSAPPWHSPCSSGSLPSLSAHITVTRSFYFFPCSFIKMSPERPNKIMCSSCLMLALFSFHNHWFIFDQHNSSWLSLWGSSPVNVCDSELLFSNTNHHILHFVSNEGTLQPVSPWRWLFSILITLVLTARALKRRSLDYSGALAGK